MAKKIVIDAKQIQSRKELFACLKEQLGAQDFIGNNLDALHDVLTEQKEPVEVELRGLDELRASLGAYADRFLRVLEDCRAVCAMPQEEQAGRLLKTEETRL